jgi:NAD(P)-dependent dehydrogenase (short-subunit alcohol dehydrogenase family)
VATDESAGNDGTRTAFVTGASSGIGAAIAVAFGALGWRVGIGSRRVETLQEVARAVEAAGGVVFAHRLDVRDAASVDAFFTAGEAALGPVDVLVNNAGIALPGALHEVDDDAHRRIVETNLLGPIYASRRAISSLLARGAAGDLVFISSDVTVHPRPKMPAYGASKAGLEHLATILALELEGTGIRTGVVRVGPTTTSFGDGWDPEVFATLLPQWQRFGLQRHWHTNDAATVARAVVSVVTLEPGSTISVLEVQPTPPR